MRKISYLIGLLLIPAVKAEDTCGITNLASCIPQKIYEFILNIINAPLQPLLILVKSLLTEPVNISLFSSLWAIMVYIISLFYGILMLYSGFNFMISGYDVVKRERAKEWFRNLLIMIILVQSSYFLYGLAVELGSILTSGIVNMIDPHFFMLTADNIVNIGLEFFLGLFYVIILFITALFLTLRYIIVACGVMLSPIGVFLYFIPGVRDYGKLILNFLGTCIFITFIDSLVLLACSMVIELPVFGNFKILVMITAFSIVNFILFYFLLFSAIKSAFKVGGEVGGIITKAGKYLV